MSLFFCQFLSAVGVFKKDCRHILRSCRLSVKPLGRPLCIIGKTAITFAQKFT